jgi:tetratricopeptide (TPR) repeat protein
MLGRPAAAREYFDQALTLARELQGPRGFEVAQLLMDESYALMWQDQLEQAEDVAREALEIYTASVYKWHPDRIYSLSTLGEVLRLRRKFSEASRTIAEALAAERQVFGEYSRRVISDLDTLSKIKRAQRRLDDAEALAREVLEKQIAAEGPNQLRTGFYRNSLGNLLIERRKFAEAEAQLRASLVVFAGTVPPDHPYVGSSNYFLGEVMLATHRPKEAEAFFRAAIDITQRAAEPKWRTARSASGLGEALYRQGRSDEAEAYLVDSYRILASDPQADEGPQVAARERVVRFYTDRAQPDRLEALISMARAPAMSGQLRVNANP